MNEIIDFLNSLGFEQESGGDIYSFIKNEGDPEYKRIFDFNCAQQCIEVNENKFDYCYLTKAGAKKGVEHASEKDMVKRVSIEVSHFGSLLPLIKLYFDTMPTKKLPE